MSGTELFIWGIWALIGSLYLGFKFGQAWEKCKKLNTETEKPVVKDSLTTGPQAKAPRYDYGG